MDLRWPLVLYVTKLIQFPPLGEWLVYDSQISLVLQQLLLLLSDLVVERDQNFSKVLDPRVNPLELDVELSPSQVPVRLV